MSLPFRYFPGVSVERSNYNRPPLGIAYLAAWLRLHSPEPVDVKCLDLLVGPAPDAREAARRILALDPDLVGLTVLTPTQPFASALAAELHLARPELRVVAGGPHVTALPEECLPAVDAKVVGEGEEALLTYLVEDLLGGHEATIPGVVRLDGQGFPREPVTRSPFLHDLDSLPFPARDLLPYRQYFHSFPYRGVRTFTTLMTSRGCPYNCNFCANRSLWGRQVRYQSVERVMAEIDQIIRDFDVNLVFIDDDTFTANRRRAERLIEELGRRRGLRWICHSRVDTVDARLAREMAAAGCVEVQLGVESGDDEVLASTNKGINLDQAHEAVRACRAAGINTWATFVLGHELDTPRTIRRTVRAAITMNPTYASFIALLPFPGTEVFDRFQRLGYLDATDWSEYSWHGRPVFHTAHFSPDDLVDMRAYANLAFYMRPSKLLELAVSTLASASWREMNRNLVAWSSLVRRRGGSSSVARMPDPRRPRS